jgi:hypothetical protein
MIRTAVFKLCGQFETVPIGVCDQSSARIDAPISPPPEKTESTAAELMLFLFPTPSSAVSGGWACWSPVPRTFTRNTSFSAHDLRLRDWLKGAMTVTLSHEISSSPAFALRLVSRQKAKLLAAHLPVRRLDHLLSSRQLEEKQVAC